MNRIAFTAAAAVAVAWSACAPATAQTPPWQGMRNPNVVVDYVLPRPPNDTKDKDYAAHRATYERHMKIYERMKKRQVLEELSAFLSPLRLPKTLRVRTVPCGEVNAYYDHTEYTVKICYEWMDATEAMAPEKVSPEGFTRQEVIVGGFVGVLLHELGHAISDILQLPVLGREEDAADQVAGFIMMQFGKDVARTAIKGTAYVWLTFARQSQELYWDTHSTPAQRFYNFLCIAYGGDQQTFRDLVDKWLPKNRVESCQHEYQQVRNAFRKTVLPHIDEGQMRKVQSMRWIRPDDGSWD